MQYVKLFFSPVFLSMGPGAFLIGNFIDIKLKIVIVFNTCLYTKFQFRRIKKNMKNITVHDL